MKGQEPLYEVIAAVLRQNIRNGRLPVDLVLIEGPIARIMQTSRAPVQTALRVLAEEGLIQRFRGRGYLVARGGRKEPLAPGGPLARPAMPDTAVQDNDAEPVPLRQPLDEIELEIPDDLRSALEVRGTWMRVYDQVETHVAACQVFGEFRLVETEMAEFLGVSRTVARDVLSRLNERGLIRKGASSHWLAGPLTARILREKFQLRAIMEPAALRLAADHIEDAEIARIREEISLGLTRSSAIFEEAFLTHCLERAPNAALVEIIRNNRLLLSSVNKALNRLGLPADEVALDDYRTLFDLIGSRQIDAASTYLMEHLRLQADKNLARLKIVALVPEQEAIPRFLVPV